MFRFVLKNKKIRNKTVVFNADQSRKIRKVLRMKIGDKVQVFDNKGWEYTVELTKITNEFSVGKIIEQILNEQRSMITLFQSLPKNLKVEFIIQKCTELGVDRIVFFQSDFSQVKANLISKEKLLRWKKIAEESSEQCGRKFISEIEISGSELSDLIHDLDKKNTYYLDANGIILNASSTDIEHISFFVGPEGGFSPKEKEIFNSFDIQSIKVGNHILRSETAGMAFLAQLQPFIS